MINIQSIASEMASAISGKLNSLNGQTTNGSADDIQAIIASVLRKMQIVTRDEFDAQTAVLLRTRQKLEQLEKQLAELEVQQQSKKQ